MTVRISAANINFGEVNDVLPATDAGSVPGWEAVGTVIEASGCGRIQIGNRVVTLGDSGGWAQTRLVSEKLCARLPEGTDITSFVSIGVAGGTAMRAVRRLGSIVGLRVLVTGAASRVGGYAIQILQRAGAVVIAHDRKAERHPAHRALGAAKTIARIGDLTDRVSAVIDTEGGATMVESFSALQSYGLLVAVGHTARDPETFPVGSFEGDSGREGRRIETIHLLQRQDGPADLLRDIEWLAEQVANGSISAPETNLIQFPSTPGIDIDVESRATLVL